jgi:Tol biopolymer transport system component
MVFPRGKLPVLWLESWAQDGSSIVYRSGDNPEAWRLPSGASTAERVTDVGTSVDQVQLSPDRRWMVYNAPESEQFEVYVAPVPANGQRWQVSKAGGVQGTWRADGRGVYYLGLDSGLYSVDLTITNGKLSPSSPRLLFRTGVPVISPYVEQYRPSADGRRFLFCLPLTSVQREPLRVLMNWPAKLEAGR